MFDIIIWYSNLKNSLLFLSLRDVYRNLFSNVYIFAMKDNTIAQYCVIKTQNLSNKELQNTYIVSVYELVLGINLFDWFN